MLRLDGCINALNRCSCNNCGIQSLFVYIKINLTGHQLFSASSLLLYPQNLTSHPVASSIYCIFVCSAQVLRFSMKWILSFPGSFLGLVSVYPTIPPPVIPTWWTWTSKSCRVAIAAVRAVSRGYRRYRCSRQEVCVCALACVCVCVWDKDVLFGVIDPVLIVTTAVTAGMLPCCNNLSVCVCTQKSVYFCVCAWAQSLKCQWFGLFVDVSLSVLESLALVLSCFLDF